jgi:hypothetical protein
LQHVANLKDPLESPNRPQWVGTFRQEKNVFDLLDFAISLMENGKLHELRSSFPCTCVFSFARFCVMASFALPEVDLLEVVYLRS